RRALPQPGAPRRSGRAPSGRGDQALHRARAVARLPDPCPLEVQAARLRAADLLALLAQLRPAAAAVAERQRARAGARRARRADPPEPDRRPPARALRSARPPRADPALRPAPAAAGRRRRAARPALLPLRRP